MTIQIMVIEDDENIRMFLSEFLTDKGYKVKAFGEGLSALKYIKKMPPDLTILDLGLPKMTGESVCKEMKKEYPEMPIIILTAKDTTSDIIKGLNIGADDELFARIEARLRTSNKNKGILKIDDLELDTDKIQVRRAGHPIQLTTQEFKLLEYLMNNKNKVLSRDIILNRVWLYSYDVDTRVVDVYIGYLRKKIDKGFKKKLIHSIRGFGYTIKE
jgi:DNA-binding response OmpR family regulator